MKHTPGPWETSGSSVLSPGHAWICIISEPRHGRQRNIDISSPDWDEGIANARLIAAAPDLLAALEQCRKAFDAMPIDVLGHNEHYGWPYLEELKSRVDTAVARARGES